MVLSYTLALVLLPLAAAQAVWPNCGKAEDCQFNAACVMPDWTNYPRMWPPCPGGGVCTCNTGFVILTSNKTCMPIQIVYNLDDVCSNVWQQVTAFDRTCTGGKVVCAAGYRRDGTNNICTLIPVTVTNAPVVNVPAVTVAFCPTVSFSQECDIAGKTACCNAAAGLTCQKPGAPTKYECRCGKTEAFDMSTGRCRPRVYGDECVANDDCNSGLIGSAGFECRYQRCRCATGYEPYENLYFNETSKRTFSRRICIAVTALSWAPTGLACTMDPHRWSGRAGVSHCHARAFCHLCNAARATYTGNEVAPVTGTCRELSCTGAGDCNVGNNRNQAVCTNANMMIDPPCNSGMCTCNANNGFYKDRFSRCNSYRKLRLGDRCIVPDGTNQLHPIYVNDEDWDDTQECVSANANGLGYTGYSNGIIKCKLPLIEDYDGNCVPNDVDRNPWTVLLSHGADCDDTDMTLPLQRCDSERGLACLNKKCACSATAAGSCTVNFGGCTSTNPTSTSNVWDGSMCRAKRVADACDTNADCCGGVCNAGMCGCAAGFAAVSYNVITGSMNNGGGKVAQPVMAAKTVCMKNYTTVGKGAPCHLAPQSWDCVASKTYGFQATWLLTQVCGSGLVCHRCPIDPEPFDSSMGICRSVNPSGIADARETPMNIDPITGAVIPSNLIGRCAGAGACTLVPSVALLMALLAFVF